MAGDTALVCIKTLTMQWDSHSSYAAICTHWTITKDQLIRLRDVIPLTLRIDRRLRFRNDPHEQPTPEEDEASMSGLALAPRVAERATVVSSQWSHDVRRQRQVTKSQPVSLDTVSFPNDMRPTRGDTE